MARTKEDAVTKARILLSREGSDGHQVIEGIDDALPVALNPESSFATLLSRVDTVCEEGNLPEVEAVMAEVNMVLGLSAVLKQRVFDLEARKAEVVNRMLNQHSDSQTSVGEISDSDVHVS
jgi:hypothetical protein